MDDSPSKFLVDGLASFHISSPDRQQNAARLASGQLNVKKYLPNNDFADSKFLSYLGDSNSKSYVRKLGDWSMGYGTVQQKPKSITRNSAKLMGETNDGQPRLDNDENIEQPQFKQYLQNNVQKHEPIWQEEEQVFRGPESELILTASLNDISGIPTNTFKRHNNKKKPSPTDHDWKGVLANEGLENGSDEDDDDDIDPALEARGVFDNILRNQKSNYEFNRGDQSNKQGIDLQDKYASDTGSSSYFGETPSSLSPNVETHHDEKPAPRKNEKKSAETVGLIKPEDVGLVFNNVDGVWYKPAPRNQDISSSRTTDNTFGDNGDSNNSTITSSEATARATTSAFPMATEKERETQTAPHLGGARGLPMMRRDGTRIAPLIPENRFSKTTIETSADTAIAKHDDGLHEQGQEHEHASDAEDDNYDDTPMELPQINPRFMPMSDQDRPTTYDASPTNDSKQLNKRELIKLLTEVVPHVQSDWSQITCIDLSHKWLKQLSGLHEILPNLTDLDLSGNEIVDFCDVPTNVMSLNLSGNQITTNYCSKNLPRLMHLQTLNLSHNKLDYSLNFLSSLKHLTEVDLSFNRITSINDNLGVSRITRLDLSNNRISGVIDFAKILKYNSNVYCNNSICWVTVQDLDLSGNLITEVRNISVLRNLKTLILDNNPISAIADCKPSESLEKLSLLETHSQLARIDMAHYQRLKQLRMDLHGAQTDLRDLRDHPDRRDDAAFPADLEQLHMANGLATQLPRWSSIPITLQCLTLTNVRGLRSLPRDLPARLPLLKVLDITGNEFASWFRVVERIPTFQLRKLVLADNPLVVGLTAQEMERIDKSIRSICPKLESLVMYDIPSHDQPLGKWSSQ